MYYPEEVVEEVRSRNDIVDVISSYVGLKRSGSNFMCCCPFHSEKTPSFSVSRQKQMFYCFGCHEGGNVISFVMKYENFTFPEALKMLADRVGYPLPEVEPSEEEKRKAGRKARLLEVNRVAAGYFHYLLTKTPQGKPGYEYFKEKRHFTDETIAKFALGYADIHADDLYQYLKRRGFPDELIRDAGLADFDERHGAHDKFWNRVMVPILDINSKCIAFGGRVLGDAKPKYLNTRETELFDKSHTLFAMYQARRSRRRGIILCEGYMDVITQHQYGFDNAVASLGTAFTPGHASMIKRYSKEVYLAYDSDNAGRNAAKKAIQILRANGLSQRVIDLTPYKDPDEFLSAEGPDAYEERIRDAIPGRLFEIQELQKQYRMDDPEEKTSFIRDTARVLAGIEDVTERSSYVETVAEKYNLDVTLLRQEVTRFGLAGIREDDSIGYDRLMSRSSGDIQKLRQSGKRQTQHWGNGSSGGGAVGTGSNVESRSQYDDPEVTGYYGGESEDAFISSEEYERAFRESNPTYSSNPGYGGADPWDDAVLAGPAGSGRTDTEIDATERHLLTWMVNRPELFDRLKEYISEEDFTGRVREVADQLYRQYRETGKVQPAQILSRYEEPDDQKVIAGILSGEFPFETEPDAAEKALTEMVRKLKLRAIDREFQKEGANPFQLAARKREIQKIRVHLRR